MKRAHGTHNHGVCDYLNTQDKIKCNDWIVTTAFYASIHFLDHAIFPFNHKGKRINNINEAFSEFPSTSKHQTRRILLQRLFPKHSSNYGFLIDQSQNARYFNYDVNDAIAAQAIRNLNAIKKDCDLEKDKIKLA